MAETQTPIDEFNNHLDLAMLQEDVAERSEGNPGAINVMCSGILSFGSDFYARLASGGYKGSAIWVLFKDQGKQDISATYEFLKTTSAEVQNG